MWSKFHIYKILKKERKRKRTSCLCTNVANVSLFVVRDDPKLPGDSGEIPISNGVVGGSIPTVKSSLYLTEKN
jgi:hypothetical protein